MHESTNLLACKPHFYRLHKCHHRSYMLRFFSEKNVPITGNCPGRARGFCEAASGDCFPVARRRFGCDVAHSDAAAADASELLVLKIMASVTRAPVASLFLNLEASHRGGVAASAAAARLDKPMQHLHNALPTILTATQSLDAPQWNATTYKAALQARKQTSRQARRGSQLSMRRHVCQCLQFHVRLK